MQSCGVPARTKDKITLEWEVVMSMVVTILGLELGLTLSAFVGEELCLGPRSLLPLLPSSSSTPVL